MFIYFLFCYGQLARSVISFAGCTCFAGHAAFPAKYGGSRLLLVGAAYLRRQGMLVFVRRVASEQEVKEAAGDEREGFSGGVCGKFWIFCGFLLGYNLLRALRW